MEKLTPNDEELKKLEELEKKYGPEWKNMCRNRRT